MNVLAVIAPHVGGRGTGSGLATLFPAEANVTVVETADEDPAALGAAHVIITGLAPVTANTSPPHRSWSWCSARATTSPTST